jgi:phasin
MEVFVEGQRIDSAAAFSAGRSPHIDIPDGVKLAAASGFAQIRDGFGRMSTNADAIMDAMEKSYFVAVKDTAGLHSKILETCQTNVSAILDFTGELAAARSPSDMVGLSTGFARRQFEAFAAQWKDFWAFTQKMMANTAKPVVSGLSQGIDRVASS